MGEGFVIFFTSIFDYAVIIQLIVVSVSVVLVLDPPKRNKLSTFLFAAKSIGFFVAEVLLHAIFFALATAFNRNLIGNSFLLGHIVATLLYAFLFCKYDNKVKLIMASTIFATAVTVIEFGTLFGKFCESTFYGSKDAGLDWMAFIKILTSSLVLCFAVIQSKFTMKRYSDVPNAGMALILVGNIISTAVSVIYEFMIRGSRGRDSIIVVFGFIVFAVLYIINIVTYMMIYFLCREREHIITLKADNQMRQSAFEMMRLSESNLSNLRQLRHEIKNQYAYMDILLENGQLEDIKKYFKSLKADVTIPISYVDSGNRNIDAILNMEMSKATAYGVEMDVKVAVYPEMPFSETAMCSILTNLIDNAIESCDRFEIKGAVVRVRLNIQSDYLYISVENPIPEGADSEKLLSFNTEKEDAVNHGYGIKIIKKIVKQYNGHITYSIEDGSFIAEVILDFLAGDTAVELKSERSKCYE